MDLGTAITGSICVLICTLPFVLIGISRRKKEKESLTALNNLAKHNNSTITDSEICGNYVIGIDKTKRTLFFITKEDDSFREQLVELSNIKDCKVTNIRRSTKNGKIIQRLYLQLSYTEQIKHEVILEFYNADINYQLSGEMESIEKWNNLIHNLLDNKS